MNASVKPSEHGSFQFVFITGTEIITIQVAVLHDDAGRADLPLVSDGIKDGRADQAVEKDQIRLQRHQQGIDIHPGAKGAGNRQPVFLPGQPNYTHAIGPTVILKGDFHDLTILMGRICYDQGHIMTQFFLIFRQ